MSVMEKKLREYRLAAIERRLAQQNRCLCNRNNVNMNNPKCPEHAMLLPNSDAENDEHADKRSEKAKDDHANESDNEEDPFADIVYDYKLAFATKCSLFLMTWLTFLYIFQKWEFGGVYVVLSLLVFICYNTRTGPKREGEISAYSVFNEGCRNIDGTFTVEQFEQELRYGPQTI